MSLAPTKRRRPKTARAPARERGGDAVPAPPRPESPSAHLAHGRPLQAFIESALDAVMIADDAGRYVEVNPAACELIGLPRAEIIGRHVQDFSAPGFDAVAAFQSFRESGRSSGNFLLYRPDGEVRDVEYAATADVLPGLHLSILRDVTSRRRTERELQQRVGELQRIYDLANAVSRAASLEEIYSEALDALTEVLGADRGSVLLLDPDGVMRFKASRGVSEAYRAKVEGHSPWPVDAKDPDPVLVPDLEEEPTLGGLRDVVVAEGIHALGFIPLVDDGRLLGKLMIYYDAPHAFSPEEVALAQTVARHVAFVITRKRAEEALRDSERELAEFFENATIPIHWLGPDGTILRVNRAELELLGYERDEFVGRSIADFHVDRSVIDDALARLANGEKLAAYPARLRAKDGSIKHVVIDSSVYFRDGQFVHTRSFTRDVTELAKAEARQRTHFAVTRVLAESRSLAEAAPQLIRAICETLGWDVGAIWTVDPAATRLRCVDLWHLPELPVPSFERATREAAFPIGVGMPGRVWATRQPAWIPDIAADSNFSRASAVASDGIRSSCGFPIENEGEFIGVVEFFSREVRPAVPELMRALTDLGSRIGQFIDRRRAGEALQESEESYRALFEVNPLPMWLRDPHTLEFVAVNDAAVRQYGYSREGFLRLSLKDVLAPEELEAISTSRAIAGTGHEPWNAGVRRHRRRDGSDFWAEVSVRDVLSSGRPLQLVLANDVTERRRFEEDYRFLAEASAMLGSSLDYRTTLRAFARLAVPRLGDSCAIDVLDSQGMPERLAVAHADPEMETIQRRYPINRSAPFGVHHVAITGESEFVSDVPGEMLDQIAWDPEHARLLKTLVGSYICAPLKARGRMLGAMTLIRSPGRVRFDARDVALAEELARRAAFAVDNARLFGEAREASVQKSRFLSAVSHDLRTPASAITLLSSLIRKEAEENGIAGSNRLVERCQRLENAASSFSDLLSDLLEIGSFDSGQKRMREEAFPLSDVLRDCIETSTPYAREKGLALRVRWDTDPPGIRADRTEFARVLMNLVSNAVKFTDRGAVKVEICRAVNGDLEVRVRDTGPGIPSEHLPSVFSEFFQVRNAERDRTKGSGLGLAISRRIMQALGGSLKVESGIGMGSTFTATLPADRVIPVPGAGERDARPRAETDDSTSRARVLVIDDDPTSREALAVLLGDEGYEVRGASGGEEGLAALDDDTPDVLLLDMMMPGMDGLEVIRKIRNDPVRRGLPIVALTGDVTRERLQNVLDAGADQFVAKPFRIPALLEAIRAILVRAP
ncbi:MAG TPA: PAS domain S-box protein [Thermoanaerobaculia bacterium]|nr:PAS domain S-box protein [Thermoanaerobaculia bacterium]